MQQTLACFPIILSEKIFIALISGEIMLLPTSARVPFFERLSGLLRGMPAIPGPAAAVAVEPANKPQLQTAKPKPRGSNVGLTLDVRRAASRLASRPWRTSSASAHDVRQTFSNLG